MRKAFSLLLSVLMLFSVVPVSYVYADDVIWDGSVADAFASGDGTARNPYLILDGAQLAYFAKTVNEGNDYSGEYVSLGSDINLNDTSSADWSSAAKEWTPIGNASAPFSGVFCGDGNTVSGIYINTDDNDQGLFGYAMYAEIRDVVVADSYINGGNNVGGIVGRSYSGTTLYCGNSASVEGNQNVGGIVGYSEYTICLISDCFNSGSVSGSGTVGGIVGMNTYSCGRILNCCNTGVVDAIWACGSITGFNYGTTSNCYYLSGTCDSAIGGAPYNLLEAYELTDEQMRNQASYSELDFSNIWEINSDSEYPYPEIDYNDDIRFLSFQESLDGTYYIVSIDYFEKYNIISVEIPESYNGLPVKKISANAFEGCTNLISVVIPDSVTEIGAGAFMTQSLRNINIPSSVTEIGDSAFAYTSITNISVPSSVTSMGSSVFRDCFELSEVYCDFDSKPEGWSENWDSSCYAVIRWKSGAAIDNSGNSNNNFSDSDLSGLLGDINGNGEIDSLDYILLKRAYFGTFQLDTNAEKRGDINGNGEIDSLDYILLKRAFFGTYSIGNNGTDDTVTDNNSTNDDNDNSSDVIPGPDNNGSVSLEPDAVYEAMIAMKSSYPEGLGWTNDNGYTWNGTPYTTGYGCAAFAFILSDAAFGTLPAREHHDTSNIRVGDILRVDNDSHSVIVLKVDGDELTLAEGNFNSSIHWGRKIKISESNIDYILTRYPQ